MKKVLILLSFIFVIIGFGSTVNAQSWVLWGKWIFSGRDQGLQDQGWGIHSAYPTYEGCVAAKREVIDYVGNSFFKGATSSTVSESGISWLMKDKNGNELPIFFLCSCFPDTIDPRK